MAKRANDLGETGRDFARNLEFYRTSNGYSLRTLQERLSDRGYSISHTALANIESGKRRAEIDDVRALADVFGIGMLTLLIPDSFLNYPSDKNGRWTTTQREAEAKRSIERFIEHNSGAWPTGVTKPANTFGQVIELANYLFDSLPEVLIWRHEIEPDAHITTHRAFALSEAVKLQRATIRQEQAEQQEEWSWLSSRLGEEPVSTEFVARASRLWWQLHKGSGRAERTLDPGSEGALEAARALDEKNLQLFTELNSALGIAFREADGRARPCLRDGTPLMEYQ